MSDSSINPGGYNMCCMTSHYLTSIPTVAIAFLAVLATAFVVGVFATIYFAWIQPAMARYTLRRQLRQQRSKKVANTPLAPSDLNNDLLNTPTSGSPSKDLEKGDAIFVKETEVTDDVLPLPKPTFAFAKKDRFSTSTHDGVWWFV